MSRLETGPHRPAPDDWTGVFIRGDNAMHYAMHLRCFLNGARDPITCTVVLGLVDLLESCRERTEDSAGEED